MEIDKLLEELPAIKFTSSKIGKYTQWYVEKDGEIRYLAKKEKLLAEKLAFRKYLTVRRKELEREWDFYQTIINKQLPEKLKSETMLDKNSPYHELLLNSSYGGHKLLANWGEEYERCKKHPDKLVHRIPSGDYVRSKSEAMIGTCLYNRGIPFRYECELFMGDMIIYPDFTIKRSEDGKVFYWEHFGMMDRDEYARNALNKLRHYNQNGIYIGIDLIMSFETSNAPLDIVTVNNIIDNYFSFL